MIKKLTSETDILNKQMEPLPIILLLNLLTIIVSNY